MGSQMNTRKKLNSGAYIEGTAVRKLSQYEQTVPEEMPGRHHAPEKRQQTPKRKTSQSRPKTRQKAVARRRARARAFQMNKGYVTFLSIAAVACLFICVNYLNLQAQVTESRKQISRMESSYSDLKLSNDAAYSKAVSSVDLDKIRDIAINELGMVYANQDQIVTYEKQDKDYVRQYEEVPKE